MKNRILLVFIFLLTMSFSFAQNNMTAKKDMKKSTAKAVEYLSDNGLKFTDKQQEVCFSAFTEYAKNIMKVQQKVALRKSNSDSNSTTDKIEARKYVNSHAMRFQKKRDDAVKQVLKGRQVAKYESLILDLHPITLEVTKTSKKGKKSKK